jgi:hypothetical protein
MIATNIVYFSLLSASWMSAVSAYLTTVEREKIERFKSRTDLENNWTEAYHEIKTETLIDYFQECGNRLGRYVERYARRVNFHELTEDGLRFIRSREYHVIDGEIEAPLPDEKLLNELRGLRKLVFLIRDSNLRTLNDIKQTFSEVIHLGPILAAINKDHPMLAAINDQMIQSVAPQYAYIRVVDEGKPIYIEPSIIDVALLYSLNSEMLGFSSDWKLRRFQTIVKHFHSSISLYLRILTRVPYFDVMVKLSEHIHKLENRQIYGYEDERIQVQLRELCDVILSVVVIYGRWDADGKRMFDGLLISHEAIRRYKDLDPTSVVPVDAWSDQVLVILAEAVVWTVNHPWHQQLRELVRMLRELGSTVLIVNDHNDN